MKPCRRNWASWFKADPQEYDHGYVGLVLVKTLPSALSAQVLGIGRAALRSPTPNTYAASFPSFLIGLPAIQQRTHTACQRQQREWLLDEGDVRVKQAILDDR